MVVRQVLTTNTVYVGGGGGSTSTSDSLSLYGHVLLSEAANNTPDDSATTYALHTTYAETNATPDDSGYNLYARYLGLDTIPSQSDALTKLNIGVPDSNATPLDSQKLGVIAFDTNAVPVEAIDVGFKGYLDTNSTPSDARSATVRTWASSQTNSGATNPANAIGQQDGVFATIAGTTGLSTSTATLTATIPVASIPVSSSGYILRIWATGSYNTLSLVTLSVTYTNTGGAPASGTIQNAAAFTSPFDTALTTIGTSLTVTFTAAGGLLGGNSISLDALAVVSTPTF